MEKVKFLTVAALVCSTLLATSCDDVLNVIDNPSTTETEQASAKDPGKWWIDENNMDKSVKPGDNFFMYCNGSWWKNTTDDKDFIDRFYDMKPTFEERVKKLTDANYQKFKSHLKWAEPGSEAAKAAQRAYDDMISVSGLNNATTPEAVLRAYGKMIAMGVSTCIWLEPFFMNGKLSLLANFHDTESYVKRVKKTSSTTRSQTRQMPFEKMIEKNPETLAHLVSIGGKAGTRAIPNEWSSLRLIVEGMGIDPEHVYVYEDYAKYFNEYDNPKMQQKIEEAYEQFKKSWQGNFTANELKKSVMDYYESDYGLISLETKKQREVVENIGNDLEPFVLDLGELENVMAQYMIYMKSKMVADQLVPKGVKEEYLRYSEELKAVFAQRIKDNAWLSDASKKIALEKLDAMVINVGYPDEWIKEGLPDFTNNQSMLEDFYTVRKARIALLKAVAGKSRKEASFTLAAMGEDNLTVMNACYIPASNVINLLPFCTLPPFFDPAQSLAINYAAMNTFGHEMTHAFDTAGSYFDKEGNYVAKGIWASAADKTEFERRTRLLVDWFSTLDVLPDERPGMKANGKRTLPEDIADLGGTEIAWQAYQNRLQTDGYTGTELKLMKQRFFLAYAEEYRSKYNGDYVDMFVTGFFAFNHSMDKERVNGVVANMDGWYDTFDITGGALYRKPADRVKIW